MKCQAKYLDPDYRYKRLLLKLEEEIKIASVICLQEVSTEWAGRLHSFFVSHNYYFVTGLYGKKFDGRMGVGIAIPMSAYNILDVDISTLSECDSMQNQMPARQPYVKKAELSISAPEVLDPVAVSGAKESLGQTGNDKQWLRKMKEILGIQSSVATAESVATAKPEPYQSPYAARGNYMRESPHGEAVIWSDALKRFNQVVSVRLQPKWVNSCGQRQKSFCVSTYHMPCAFRTPGVMLVHSVLLLKHVQQFVRDKRSCSTDGLEQEPSILVGDFNFKPGSLMYNAITNFKYFPAAVKDSPSSVDGFKMSTGSRNTIVLDQDAIEDLFKIGTNANGNSNGNGVSSASEWREVFNSNSRMTREQFDWTLRSTTDCDSTSASASTEPTLYSSAYIEHNGCEPDFTNYAFTRGNGDPQDFQSAFIDTLDYIFFSSPHWEVQSVKPLPNRLDFQSVAAAELAMVSNVSSDSVVSMPTSDEPSDHLLLSACLTLR